MTSEMRKRIGSELYEMYQAGIDHNQVPSKYGPVTDEDRHEATDRILALVREALLSDEVVEAMLNAANRKGHLLPKRDPQRLPDSYAFRRQRLDICKSMGQAALTAIGIGEEQGNEQ